MRSTPLAPVSDVEGWGGWGGEGGWGVMRGQATLCSPAFLSLCHVTQPPLVYGSTQWVERGGLNKQCSDGSGDQYAGKRCSTGDATTTCDACKDLCKDTTAGCMGDCRTCESRLRSSLCSVFYDINTTVCSSDRREWICDTKHSSR